MFKTSSDAFAYLEGFTNFERKNTKLREYRLDRMKILLSDFGNPQLSVKTFHIAGSKGKGTTAIFTASALSAAGFKTGLYSSPHVLDYRERITIAGEFFKEQLYVKYINDIKTYLDSGSENNLPGDEKPTTFELLTLLAFLMFRGTGCDYAVLETGLGGRLDATNLSAPLVSIITSIELEHTSVLGNTIQEIAMEKAGIIKPGIPVIIAAEDKTAVDVIKTRSSQFDSPAVIANSCFGSSMTGNPDFTAIVNLDFSFDCPGFSQSAPEAFSFRSNFCGSYAPLNAAAAVLAIRTVLPDFKTAHFIKGFESAKLKGRNEIWKNKQTFIFDVAHTAASVKALMESVKNYYPDGGILVFGLAKDKDPLRLIPYFGSWPDKIFVTSPGFFKESDPAHVFRCFTDKGYNNAELVIDPADVLSLIDEAIDKAEQRPILVTGSFYLVSSVQKKLLLNQ